MILYTTIRTGKRQPMKYKKQLSHSVVDTIFYNSPNFLSIKYIKVSARVIGLPA
jgi:hypothetical protein